MKRIITFFSAMLAMVALSAQNKYFGELPSLTPTPEHAGRMAGNLADSSMTYSWSGSAWNALAKKVFTYDAQGRVSIIKEYDPISGVLEHQSVYSYHSNGELSLVVVTANKGGNMELFERYRYNFDSQDNRTSYRKDVYFMNSWQEEGGDSVLYEYDANNRILAYTLFQIDAGAIYYFQKLLWSDFNPQNQPQTLIVQVYQGGFENYIRLSNMRWGVGYDAFNFTPTAYVGSTWNGSWNAAVYDTSMVSAGKIQKSYQFYYNGINIIDTSSRTEYLYDKLGHRMQTLSYQYNGSSWSVSNGDRDSIEYGNYDEIKKQTLSFYSNSNQNWEYLNEERFYYNGLSIGEMKSRQITLYPNPAADRVNLVLETAIESLTVTDLHGKIFDLPLEGKQLDVRTLPAGVYLIRLQSEGTAYTGKLLIRH